LAAAYLDTSALAKLYHEEVGSTYLEQLLLQTHRTAFLSRLGVLEMHSVLAGKVRTGEITLEKMDLARRAFRWDVRHRRFRVIALRVKHYEYAEALLGSYGSLYGLRTLDALQLAVALDSLRNHLLDSLITADRVLSRVAPLEGLEVINPELTRT